MVRNPAVWIGVALAVAITSLLAFGALDAIELPLRDAAIRAVPERPASSTVVVAIDERSLRAIGPWPWRRETLAAIVRRAADARASGVVLDVLLADARPGDEVLAAAMQSIPTVAVAALIESEQWLVPAPAIRERATVAHGNFELDHDGILRRFATTKQSGDRSCTAVSLVAASLLADRPVPVGRSVAPAFRTPPRAVPQISAADLLAGRFHPSTLRNRLVFVGPTALGLGDRVLTPVSASLAPDAGVTVHAAATESLLRGERIRAVPPLAGGLAAALLGGSIVATRRAPRRRRLALAIALPLVIVAGGFALFAASGLAIPFATLVLTIIVSASAVEVWALSASSADLGVRLEEIATRMAEQRARDLESKRVLAHELKTPLASMRNLTQLLAGFELSAAERRRVTSLLESEAGRLQAMVTALLDLERLPLRDFQSSTSVTDLGDLVNARIELLRTGNDRLTASASTGVLVRADALLLGRVVDNLVGNALKYGGGTPVRVKVRQANGEAVLEVADGGRGIPAVERERIFQRFFRGTSATGTEGLGLGLSLVAEVARWHRGSVSIDTAPEGGSLFRFILPVAERG